MRISLSLVVWTLALGIAALDTDHGAGVWRDSDAGHVAKMRIQESEHTLDIHSPTDNRQASFDKALKVLQQYQSSLKSHNMPGRYESQLKTYRDISSFFPKVAREYVQGAARVFSSVFGLTDRTAARYASHRRNSQPKGVKQAIQTVRKLAEQGHEESLFALAEIEMYGKYGSALELDLAFEHYQQLADISGNATAQYMLGLFYAVGLGSTEQQNGMSLLYTTLSAIQGYIPAEATLAFKYLSGIGVPVSCNKALSYYQSVARKAIQYYNSGPVMGRHMPDYRARLSDDNGGAYGVRTGPYSLHKVVNRKSFDELLLYHQQNALKGDIKASMTLVDLFYHGHRFAPRNFALALKYLRQVNTHLFTQQGELRKGLVQSEVNAAAQAAGMYGIMCLRGEGQPVDTAAALKWLKIGAKMGHGISYNALGVMYQAGIEVPPNRDRAIELFKLAAERRHQGGQVNFALAIIDAMPEIAHENLRKAAEKGHILAHYHLAELYSGVAELFSGVNGAEMQCRMAVASYKFVAEYGDWLHSPIPSAATAYQQGRLDAAALSYMQAAEMGYGVGQLNAAQLLETAARRNAKSSAEAAGQIGNGNVDAKSNVEDGQATAVASLWSLFKTREAHVRQTLAYWTRAANQDMPDARVKQGDHYFYGQGVEQSSEKAAAAYTIAAEVDANGLAMWNLGWMYEHGIGVQRDFFLAKRWYDKSIEVNDGGKLANYASLARLCVKYVWAWLSGDDVGESPLFFAPRPVTQEEEDRAQAEAGADGREGQVRNINHYEGDNYVPDDWEHGAGALDTEDMDADEEPAEEDESLSGNLFFIALFLAAGWMFLPFR
ncbi:ERAD-associated protein [Coemansia sp. RSA 1807]|nr:ERAD-associated protein [Coemansia sp. RSA 1591]KAJ1768335.1 ERAD-associated protein [Coemansia sp. RSA 1752]KAJ1795311.1 ERAD-associated protein [Coemansia sp. RSA 1938]KAJ2155256.1 ERAD-associated protein [Coemansia sp. RSA 637]KAJ2283965.1 ERAD-associated protein [Coemansia sp. RSA 370]KAJ2292364.1 ERAD-associated protein [Coemansia sp. RSA 355]KAJ2447768.1 ERAD-associated protein [Coemansia sp. RSA 2440]KAJ2573936.1 ERAD-associated protein [Coemansia sp. RSA 1807]KAJ2723758.1 ERAD-as